MNPIERKVCIVCGKTFCRAYKETQKRWEKRRYCGHACYQARPRVIENRICAGCGKTFTAKPHTKTRHCSRSCWTKSKKARQMVKSAMAKYRVLHPVTRENNPNWKGGITGESRTRLSKAKWQLLKKRMMRLYRGTCGMCGRKENLHVHHILPWRYGGKDTTGNLMVLCAKCHPIAEAIHYNQSLQNAIGLYCKKMCKVRNIYKCNDVSCSLYQHSPFLTARTHQDCAGREKNKKPSYGTGPER